VKLVSDAAEVAGVAEAIRRAPLAAFDLEFASADRLVPALCLIQVAWLEEHTPLDAPPAAIVAEPPGGTIGVACPKQGSGVVYVAYPSCHSVAAINAGDGSVLGHIDFDSTGVATYLADGNLSCPDECGAGGAIAPGIRPVALDVKEEARSHRKALAIGADNSSRLTVVNLDPTT